MLYIKEYKMMRDHYIDLECELLRYQSTVSEQQKKACGTDARKVHRLYAEGIRRRERLSNVKTPGTRGGL